jgi:hypothetical protein
MSNGQSPAVDRSRGENREELRALPATQEVTPPQTAQTIQIVCADSGLADQYRKELGRCGELRSCAIVSSPAEAHNLFRQSAPLVTLLDESAVPAAEALEPAAALLAEAAPVVVVAALERQPDLAFLMLSGAADFVPRSGSFVSIAAGRVERRVRLSAVVGDLTAVPGRESAADFGEIFRHELNNELTAFWVTPSCCSAAATACHRTPSSACAPSRNWPCASARPCAV